MYPDARPFPPSGGRYFFYGFAKKRLCGQCGVICRRTFRFGIFARMVWRIHVIFNLYRWQDVMYLAWDRKYRLAAFIPFWLLQMHFDAIVCKMETLLLVP
jgi:hypothetical protein